MQQAARVSRRTACFHPGHLVVQGETDHRSPNPADPRTESPVSGRIG